MKRILARVERKRARKRRRRATRIAPVDVAIGFAVTMIAGFSIYLPLDAHFNADGYSPPELEFSRGGKVPADEIGGQQPRTPLFDAEQTARVVAPDEADPGEAAAGATDPVTTAGVPPGVDPVTTGTVPQEDSPRRVGEDAAVYTLVDARPGSALIADRQGIYLVRRGARLPDGRRVVAVSGQGATVRIELAGGDVARLEALE
ncbi:MULTISPECIES: hypothetical protein [unclassified Roseitalea]|uniref:hypothetical protein n=1 Tax=unclassified Roseitalea TaxID=2639107 RepID=UPI00273F7B91|nr:MULTISPECIES: hypothetical protein [unclassified Roseitalea]